MASPHTNATAQKKSRRPVLSPHTAQAHAFATVPPPGGHKPNSTSYFPLPTPPAPLRRFALQNDDSSTNAEGSTLYPTSIASSKQDPVSVRINNAENAKEVANRPASSTPTHHDPPKSPKTRQSQSSVSAHRFEFASAAPFSSNLHVGSSGLSSSSSHSARSALSIAEIDCFFVQGSRSSVYSARSRSSLSRPPSEADGSSAPLSEVGISSNEDPGEEKWMSDEAERERQRAERRAFMKARQNMREEARRRRRTGGGVEELSPQSHATWREAIRTQAVIPLKGVPAPRSPAPAGMVPQSPLVERETCQAPLPNKFRTQQPPPSGPGPPAHPTENTAPVDTLAASFSSHMTFSMSSDPAVEGQMNDPGSTPPLSDSPPSLTRSDSGQTAVGTPAT